MFVAKENNRHFLKVPLSCRLLRCDSNVAKVCQLSWSVFFGMQIS
uniref:Uncharacterized protein n=1 Tax=Arundo donax TaxID=35708 RepID=A0A0A9H6S7_ARUDO